MPPTVFHNQKHPLFTYLVPGKVEKENHIRKVGKSEERKVKNIGMISFYGSCLMRFFFENCQTKSQGHKKYCPLFIEVRGHTGESPSLNQIGHVSRIYLTTMHVNSISNKKIQKIRKI